MLTPQLIEAMNKASGNNVPINPSAPPSRADQIRAIAKSATPNISPAPAPKVLPNITPTFADSTKEFTDYAHNIADAGAKPQQEAAIKVMEDARKGADSQTIGGKIGAGIDVAGDIAGGVVKSIAGVTNEAVIKPLANAIGDTKIAQAIATSKPVSAWLDNNAGGIQYLADKWNQFKTDHPEPAKKIEDAGNIAQFMTLFIGDNPATKETVVNKTIDLKNATVDKTKNVISEVNENIVKPIAEASIKNKAEYNAGQVAKADKIKTQAAIDAVNPDLSGKKLAGAYKEIVTSNRTAGRSGIIGEQALSPSQQAINVGTRLKDVLVAKDPLENLNHLHTALKETEAKLEPLLEKDITTGTKDELATDLDTLKAKVPREYKSIKENGEVFNNVIDFAKEMIDQHPESTKGFREARSAFDSQAKTEFPSAYKDGGFIDTKTPAGRAIRLVRDTINDYNYSHASGGSEIETLIQRESDIFRASDAIAPKAARLHGSSTLARFYREHPVLGGVLKKTMNVLRLGETLNLAEKL